MGGFDAEEVNELAAKAAELGIEHHLCLILNINFMIMGSVSYSLVMC